MKEKTSPSFAEFARDLGSDAFAEELRGSWATAILYRGPGIGAAWLAARIGLRPTAITLVALILALSLPLIALFVDPSRAAWLVCLVAILFQILDCADGTLARATAQTSRRGGDLDFLVDMAQWALLYVAIGILADKTFDTGHFWTAIAACAAWARLMARVVRDRLAPPAPDTEPKPIRPADFPSIFLGGISGLLPFLALSGMFLHLAVLWLLIYALLDIAEGSLPLFRP